MTEHSINASDQEEYPDTLNEKEPLYQADCHLEYARLYIVRGNREKAKQSYSIAKGMIERMGYHRRDKDVAEIARQL